MNDVVFKEDTHQYFRGLQELASVSKVIRSTWPIKPSWDQVSPEVLENARERGVETDALFSAWVSGGSASMPENGWREDARDRFVALTRWWNRGVAQAQVILADDEIAGQANVVLPQAIYDLKNTAQIESTYSLQLGAYADLYEKEHGRLPDALGVIHVTHPKGKPVSIKLVEFDVMIAVSEWRIVRQMWTLVKRKGGSK